jgi:hypothetical protein
LPPDGPVDLPLRCACGALRGVVRGVSARAGNRVVCYCDDCQSFAHFLGGTERILDAHGGTEIFQTSPARVAITAGAEHLACMRLRPGGLVRWYAGCCRTPIGNTLATRQVPFVGLIHACTPAAAAGRSRDDALGPIRGRAHTRFAKGDRAQLDSGSRTLASMIVRFAATVLVARLRGDHRRSPFFDAQSGAPIATPHVLGPEELRRVEAARDA